MCTILVLHSLLALRLNWIGNGLLIEKDMYSTLLLVQSLKSDAKEPTRGHGLNNLATNYISLVVVKYFNKLQDFVVWGQPPCPRLLQSIADGCTLLAESSAMCIVSSLPEHTPGGTTYKWDGYLSGLLV